MVRSGRMRHRIKIIKDAVDENGDLLRDEFGGLTGEKTVVAFPWCKVRHISDAEDEGTKTTGQYIIEFEIRYSKSLENPDSDMYILFKDVEYDIISAINLYELNEKLVMMAKTR